ncbi:MAG TPA: hypothetical protein VE076_05245 [Nitrososphaeraceae archaeon]|jgi:hypothetical protein|nr:hypothetical protein [Nitrososphaeraceae archaeon]
MVIEQQCENCSKKGKNVYCNNCIKAAEYFEVFKYSIDDNNNSNSRFGKGGQPTDRIKAYTWHDAIEYVKCNYFEKKSKENLNIDCEKDFAYLEEIDNNNSENLSGYSIYLNKEVGAVKSSSLLRDEDFCDLTVYTTPSSSDGNSRTKLYREEPQQQQQTVEAAIEPNPINQLTSTTPAMITRSIKEQAEEKD